MAERWFLFVQLEIPWELGPADGRYLLRGARESEPQHVVVLNTLTAPGERGRRRGLGLGAGRTGRARRGRAVAPQPDTPAVTITRATVVDPVPLAAESQARAWLDGIDVEHEMQAAAGVLNRVVEAQRIATADPYLQEISAAQALCVRAGWGVGEQVADGDWQHARELLAGAPRWQRRATVLRPQERLTWMLGGRETPLLCEELTLRARRDLDQGRPRLAAVELRSAYAHALVELDDDSRQDLALRVAELRELADTLAVEESAETGQPEEPQEPALRHALERLEAALRARSASLQAGGP